MSVANAERALCWLLAVLLSACVAQAEPAQAQLAKPRGPALNWVRLPGAESCIGPVALAARVERRLGRSVFVPVGDALIVIEGFVAPQAAGYRAVLQVSDQEGHVYGSRELVLEQADCRRLDEIAALVIAVTIHAPSGSASGIALPPEIATALDALFAGEPRELDASTLPVASERPATHAPQQRLRATEPVPPGPRPASGQIVLGAGLGFAGASGLQPSGTLGPSFHLALRAPALGGLVLSGLLGLSSRTAIDDPTGSAAGAMSFHLAELGIAVCGPELRLAGSALSLCGNVGAGRLTAQASGFVQNGAAAKFWFELGPDASARVTLFGPFYVRLVAGLPIRLSRPRFEYRRADGRFERVFSMAPVGVRAELALGGDFL